MVEPNWNDDENEGGDWDEWAEEPMDYEQPEMNRTGSGFQFGNKVFSTQQRRDYTFIDKD